MVIMSLGDGIRLHSDGVRGPCLRIDQPRRAGVASAMINTSRQVGGTGDPHSEHGGCDGDFVVLVANAAAGPAVMPEALTRFHRGFYVGAALLLAAAVVVFFAVRIGADAVERQGHPLHIGGGAGTRTLPIAAAGAVGRGDSPGGRPPASIRSIPAPIRTRTQDGIGDLRESSIGWTTSATSAMETVWVSPFFASP